MSVPTSLPIAQSDSVFDTQTFAVRSDALIRDYGSEAVGWSPDGPFPVHLDPVSNLVRKMLDGSAPVGDLAADIHDVVGVPQQVARNQLRRAISMFDQAALLASSEAPDPPEFGPTVFPGPPNP